MRLGLDGLMIRSVWAWYSGLVGWERNVTYHER